MLDKLNKIKWSYLSTLAINTHNELSCNNSKFENLQKEIVGTQFAAQAQTVWDLGSVSPVQ